MQNERTKNALNNLYFGYLSKIVDLLAPFIVRTTIIYVLGVEYLGINSLFTSILNMLSMTELGFSSAIIFSLYKPLAENDVITVCGLMTYYKKIYMFIGLIISILGIILIPFLQYLIKEGTPADINIYIIYLFFLSNTVLSYFTYAYKSSLLHADQKTSVVSKNFLIINLVKNIMQIIFLFLFRSYYLYIILLPLSTLAHNLFISHAVNKAYPQYVKKGKISYETKKELLKQVKGIFITKVCGVMRNSIDSITLSAFVGLTSVAIYGNYFYIITAVHGLLTVITTSIRAGIGHSLNTESFKKNSDDFLKFNFFYMIIASVCFASIICLTQDFMMLWLQNKNLLVDFSTLLLFASYFFLLCLSDIRNVYIEAKGMWWDYRYRAIIETFLNLILNIIFVNLWGITGILIATIITFLTINLIYGTSIIFKKYFGIELLKIYIKQIIHICIYCIISTLLSNWISNFISFQNNYLELSTKAIVCFSIALLCCLLLNFKNMYLKSIIIKISKKYKVS